MRDELYKSTKKILNNFNFNEDTANVFNDMLKRSVPHYYEIQNMICDITKHFLQKNSNIYDLGCSTGNTLLNILKELKTPKFMLIGIDNSEPMLKKAKKRLRKLRSLNKCKLLKRNLNTQIDFQNACIIISSLTLQFILPTNRKKLISQIYNGLNKNGAFILIEKIVFENKKINRTYTELYYNFKIRKGYSKLEILRKKRALEKVLFPYRYEENVKLLKEAGFRVINEFFRWYNFCGILAIK
jgi:tRNA (cmo5U34)-methyltransferase